jgi:mannonate dehydratase
MIQIAEYLPPEPTALWKLVRQVGVGHAVGRLPVAESGERPWDFAPLKRMKAALEKEGFELAVIEASPPMQKIRLGLPGRDEEIEEFNRMVRNMGELGIPVICYNFMAVMGWTRTHLSLPARGGALATGYDHSAMRDQTLTDAGTVPEERMWENLCYFLERAVPVAEKAGVKLAMHPDDPPLSPLRGIGRIMRSVENYQRLFDLVPSEVNGATLCQGNFALMTDDLPGVIREFGRQGKIFFVHLRDVRGTADRFVEVFHDEGPTDLLECLRAYRDIGFDGVLRPDHVPTLEGEDNADPCYATMGRLFAIGYIAGLRESVYGKVGGHTSGPLFV